METSGVEVLKMFNNHVSEFNAVILSGAKMWKSV